MVVGKIDDSSVRREIEEVRLVFLARLKGKQIAIGLALLAVPQYKLLVTGVFVLNGVVFAVTADSHVLDPARAGREFAARNRPIARGN